VKPLFPVPPHVHLVPRGSQSRPSSQPLSWLASLTLEPAWELTLESSAQRLSALEFEPPVSLQLSAQ
jgi:hypothetical protein